MRTAAVSESDTEAFARSGLAHLFVPSGSQVTLLMGLVWFAHRYIHLPPLPSLLALLAFYLPLTQGEPSIYRAILMGLYAFAGWVWFREVDWHTALWLSSALLVLVKPDMLHDAGFQLSYAATFGLVYASPLLSRWLSWLPEWLRFPMAATLSAQLFLTPILMHYFGRVSLIGPIANLFAVLPASFALTLGFVSALLSSLTPLAAMPISLLAGKLASFVVGIAHAFAAPSWACLFAAPPSAVETLMMLAVLTASVAWLKGNQTSGREKMAMPLTNP
jgi:competence protein ComEC